MRYLILALVVLSGCASAPSEYNQGCLDGVGNLAGQLSEHNLALENKNLQRYCDALEIARAQKRKLEQEVHGRGRQ